MKPASPAVRAYLESLQEDRRDFVEAVREAVLAGLPEGLEEVMQYRAISWVVPFERLPVTYNGLPLAFAALASQKRYVSFGVTGMYWDESEAAWFREAVARAGKPLDMGAVCVRFKRLESVPLDVITESVSRWSVEAFLERYEAWRAAVKAAPRKG